MRLVFSGPISVKKRRTWVQPSSFHSRSVQISESALLIRRTSWSYRKVLEVQKSSCFPSINLYLICKATWENELQDKRTKVVSRFGKVVAKAKAIFTIDERASFTVDKLVDTEESC